MTDYIKAFAENDRHALPEGMVWVTAGEGADSILIFGSEKTALMDCGMAYCGDKLVRNIEKALAENGRATLDFVLVSHTHYDHVGALPYVISRWPEVQVVGSAKAQYVFTRPGAIKVMKTLGEAARDEFSDSKEEIRTDGLRVDIVLGDNDTLSLGKETVTAFETKGHTDCCLSYAIEPGKILFASESTGVVVPEQGITGSEILKSTDDALAACDKLDAYGPEIIICPHYGVVPKVYNEDYFKSMKRDAESKKAIIKEFYDKGLNEEEILEEYTKKFFVGGGMPIEAFKENAKNTIGVMLWEVSEEANK